MKYMRLFTIILIVVLHLQGLSQQQDTFRFEDKLRIREAMDIAKNHGDKIWENFSSVPFIILLVTNETEYLVNHPNPSVDFISLGEDEVLKTKVYRRKRVFAPTFLATFPAVNGVPTIVVGTPENTGKNSSEWIITLLHEHFHQYQMRHPDYFTSVNTLDLSGGDSSGMWMLNYPFAYDSVPVLAQHEKYVMALQAVIKSKAENEFSSRFKEYIFQRNLLKKLLKPSDYRYLSFQVWQEGIARYTEFKFLEILAAEPTSSVYNTFNDFVSYKELKENFYKNEIANLTTLKLNEVGRVAFYSLGLAEGLLLDKINKEWRKDYLNKKFFIENYASQYQ